MPERKKIIHYCAKCGKEMKYEEKKMLYIYDVVPKKRGDFDIVRSEKRMAINLCGKCCNELQKIINDWKES